MSRENYRGKFNLHDYGQYFQNYYNEYFDFNHAYICTYYHVNMEASLFDNDLEAGSYDQLVGDHSGYVWDVIYSFPIFTIDKVDFRVQMDEQRGVFQELETTISFPSMFGLEPMFGDVLIFEDIHNPALKRVYYVSTTLEKSIPGNKTYFRVGLKGYNILDWNQFYSQVNDSYIFVDIFSSIYELDLGLSLLAAKDLLYTLENKMDLNYKSPKINLPIVMEEIE